jgi:hypothetical protein
MPQNPSYLSLVNGAPLQLPQYCGRIPNLNTYHYYELLPGNEKLREYYLRAYRLGYVIVLAQILGPGDYTHLHISFDGLILVNHVLYTRDPDTALQVIQETVANAEGRRNRIH